MADGPFAPEPPLCGCGRRHWFLDPCADGSAAGLRVGIEALDPPPTQAEIVKAVRYYRAHLKRERDRHAKKRVVPAAGT